MNIKQIKADWHTGMTFSEIAHKHGITSAQAYAIIDCSIGLSAAEIEARLQGVRLGMSALEIETVMKGEPCTNS